MKNFEPQSANSKPRILIAGIGNIFFGDDAFGCEVARVLSQRDVREDVLVSDFGIRSYDLAYALVEDYEAIILVDAVPRGAPPGTVSLIQPETSSVDAEVAAAIDAHTMNPVSAIQMAQQLGPIKAKLYLVGCEPERLTPLSDGELPASSTGGSLSAPVQAAVPRAVERIELLLEDLLHSEETVGSGARV